MRWLEAYTELGLKNEDQVFDYLISNLKPSITLWSYFVNWDKVIENVRTIEVNLNILNYLIGKDNFDEEFIKLITEHPKIVGTLPALAVRDGKNTKKFKIIASYENQQITYEEFDFTKKVITDDDAKKYLEFITKTGIKNLFINKSIKNLVDYMTGVEAGLDSNGRKNRSGHSMENIVEAFVRKVSKDTGSTYLKEANAQKIKQEFGVDVPVDKSSRRYDFVIKHNEKIYLIETNYYGGGGSKLKSTAGEYRNLQDKLDNKFTFIWITDGLGWHTTTHPLRETFDNNDIILNLKLLESGLLNRIVTA